VRRLLFHPEARAELVAAIRYHEAERPGYGAKFRDEARAVIERASELPGVGQRERGYPDGLDVRAFQFDLFPYAVIVVVEEDELLVVAVAHGRRFPGYWRTRL
tara:strand:- start:161 stop:469 length:309 start_codon:yes stop_codon:yes gene_type:complete